MAKRVTVIDIGSNSVRMVVYEKTSRFSFHILHEEKSRVRISENSYQNGGNLQEIPMQRTFDALDDFLSISKSYKSRKILCVATSALRDAPNKKEFIHKVRDRLKLNIKIIDGQKEAYFGAIACANLLPKQKNSCSIDIGGGSTEFAIINETNISHTLSLNIGTLRVKELFLDKNNLIEAREYIDNELQKIDTLDINLSTLIGIGGTFRSISMAIMKNSNYPFKQLHAYEYSKEELETFISKILATTNNDELKSLGIDNNRLDNIKSGALIVERILLKIEIANVISSGVGLREGVYLSDLLRHSKHRFPHNYNSSVRYLIDRYIEDTNYTNQLNSIVKNIFDLTSDYFNLDKKYRYELGLSAKLYFGNKYSYYPIETSLEYGFKHSEIVLIATLQKYATNMLPKKYITEYQQLLPDANTLDSLSYILSLSIALLTHKPRNIDFELEFEEGVLNVVSKKQSYLSKEAVKKLASYKDFRINF